MELKNNVPTTDEEVEESFSKWGASGYSALGIYKIFRSRDGLDVMEAYMKTLSHVIDIWENAKTE